MFADYLLYACIDIGSTLACTSSIVSTTYVYAEIYIYLPTIMITCTIYLSPMNVVCTKSTALSRID